MAKVKLTKKRIENESLTSGKAKTIYDEDVTNLYIRISKTKKVFYYRYRFEGKSNKFKIGDFPMISLKEARIEALEIYKKVLNDIDPKANNHSSNGRDEKEESSLSFEQAMKKYREHHISTLRENTITAYDSIIDNLIDFNSIPVDQVSRKDISEYLLQRKSESVYSARRDRGFLSGFFNWCISMEYTDNNPVSHAIQISVPAPRGRFHDEDEIRKIYKALPTTPQPLGDIIQFIMLTGKRRGETTELKYSMIDWKKRMLTIPANITKNNNEDKVYLTDSVVDLIKYRRDNYKGEYIFNSTYKKLDQPIQYLDNQVRTFKRISKIDDFRLQDLRKTVTVQLSKMKVPANVKDLILNNASASQYSTIRGTYDVHDYLEQKKEALIKLEKRIEEIITKNKNEK